MLRPPLCAFVLALLAGSTIAQATVWDVSLEGKGGPGLLFSNVHGGVSDTTGSGNEVGPGILYDDVSNQLEIDIAWGSANGFSNLSGSVTTGHIHGPTASNSPASFLQNIGVMVHLPTFLGVLNPSASQGFYNDIITFSAAQEANLFDGRLYIDFHTAFNPSGEIRGQLLIVPEPALVLGDANHDGAVNTFDFNELASHFNQTTTLNWTNGDVTADFNVDGLINALDFNAIATNFGAVTPGPSAGMVVPESGSLAVLLAGMFRLRMRSQNELISKPARLR